MHKTAQHIVEWLMLILCLLSVGCSKSLPTTDERLAQADLQLEELEACLQRTPLLDSIQPITTRTEGVYFYIFNAGQMVYWSDNRLNVDSVAHPNDKQLDGDCFSQCQGLEPLETDGNVGYISRRAGAVE